LDELARDRRADDLGSQAEDVHVVVLDALVRAVRVVADRRPDAYDLARGDSRADARAADEHAALRVAGEAGVADLLRLVRVVDPHGRVVRAEVEHGVHGERLQDGLTQHDAAVVERNSDSHATRSSSAVARATMLSTL